MPEAGVGADQSGPHIGAAFFCERILTETDGPVSAIRIIDRLIHQAIGIGTPEEMPPVPVTATLFVMLKSGAARGGTEFKIEVERPDGLRSAFGPTLTIHLEGDDRGNNLVFPVQVAFTQQGLYWFDVIVGGVRLTRVPLRIVYLRQEAPQPPEAAQ
jgi:hypothetical protein